MCVRLYFWENENSPGDSISGSFEKLLQRVRVEGQYISDFVEEGSTWNQALILQKVAASLGKIQHKIIMYWELKF